MNSEDPMLFKQTLGNGGVRLRAAPPTEPERRNFAMRHWVVRRLYLDAGYQPRLSDPAITTRTQPGGTGGAIDPLLEGQRSGDGEPGSVIKHAGMSAGHYDVGATCIFGGSPVDAGQRAFADMKDTDAERRAQPLVAIQLDEITVEARQREIELLPAVCSVDDHVDRAGARHRGNLADRDHQAGAMAHMVSRMSFSRGSSAIACA